MKKNIDRKTINFEEVFLSDLFEELKIGAELEDWDNLHPLVSIEWIAEGDFFRAEVELDMLDEEVG